MTIPSVAEKPVKHLGKVYTSDLKDTTAQQACANDLSTWLTTVDKSGLPGKFKAWIYQHGILPRLLRPVLMYEVPITTMESYDRKVSHFLCRWLGLPCSLSSIASSELLLLKATERKAPHQAAPSFQEP